MIYLIYFNKLFDFYFSDLNVIHLIKYSMSGKSEELALVSILAEIKMFLLYRAVLVAIPVSPVVNVSCQLVICMKYEELFSQ